MSEGHDSGNGDLRAIKRLVIKPATDRPEIESEIAVHEAFKDTRGFVRSYGCTNPLRGLNLDITTEYSWSLEAYLVMERGSSFLNCFRKVPLILDGDSKRMLGKQLLAGPVAIHDKG